MRHEVHCLAALPCGMARGPGPGGSGQGDRGRGEGGREGGRGRECFRERADDWAGLVCGCAGTGSFSGFSRARARAHLQPCTDVPRAAGNGQTSFSWSNMEKWSNIEKWSNECSSRAAVHQRVAGRGLRGGRPGDGARARLLRRRGAAGRLRRRVRGQVETERCVRMFGCNVCIIIYIL